MCKAREISQFREHAHGGGELHPAHGLQGQYGRVEAPVDHCLAQGGFDTAALRDPVLDSTSIFVKGQLLPRAIEYKGTAPAPVRWSPVASAAVADSM